VKQFLVLLIGFCDILLCLLLCLFELTQFVFELLLVGLAQLIDLFEIQILIDEILNSV
jgi:hypothetical protein